MWPQDTTVVDSALREALVDTIYVAVGGGWATAAPIIASVVAAAAAVAIVLFAWATHNRDNEDRKERTRATDTRVSVRAHVAQGQLDFVTTASGEAFDALRQFRMSPWHKKLQADIQSLVEESPGASPPVSEAIRLAYLNFYHASDLSIDVAEQSGDPSIQAEISVRVYDHLVKCKFYLLKAVDDGLKSAAVVVVATVEGNRRAELKYANDEDAPSQ